MFEDVRLWCVVEEGYDAVSVVTEVSWEVSLSHKTPWRLEAIR